MNHQNHQNISVSRVTLDFSQNASWQAKLVDLNTWASWGRFTIQLAASGHQPGQDEKAMMRHFCVALQSEKCKDSVKGSSKTKIIQRSLIVHPEDVCLKICASQTEMYPPWQSHFFLSLVFQLFAEMLFIQRSPAWDWTERRSLKFGVSPFGWRYCNNCIVLEVPKISP